MNFFLSVPENSNNSHKEWRKILHHNIGIKKTLTTVEIYIRVCIRRDMLYISISATLYSLQWAKENERLSIQTERIVPVCSKMHSFLHHRIFSFCTQKRRLFFTNSFIHFSSTFKYLSHIIFLLAAAAASAASKANNWTPEMRWILSLSNSRAKWENETNKWIKKRNKINCRGIILFVLWKWKSE